MDGVDLSRYRFDFDLTFAAMTLHPDGTIYHRYGGRDHKSPMAWMSMPSFIRVLEDSLRDHASYSKNPSPPKFAPKKTIRDLQPWARKFDEKNIDCVHCHMVHSAERAAGEAAGTWTRDDMWVWPEPERVGLTMDPADQNVIQAVAADSPAEKSGVQRGDRIEQFGDQKLSSIADMQWILEQTDKKGGTIPMRVRRGDDRIHLRKLELGDGWRKSDPLTYSWRAYKWELRPAPGFGGRDLEPGELRKLGLPADAYAFRVGYIVDWGDHARLGRYVREAGLRRDDIVTAVAGKRDFESQQHFHSWFRLTRQVGETVEIEIYRKGKKRTLQLEVTGY